MAEKNIDMKRLGLLAIGLALGSFSAMAQTDDVYFVPKKSDRINKERQDKDETDADVYYSGSNRNVDEYNRRTRNGSRYQKISRDSLGNIIVEEDVEGVMATRDRGYNDRSRRDNRDYYDEDDYYYSRRVSRFYDPWFFGYYGYSPYYGYSRWDWDWYDPFYYSYGPRWHGHYAYWYNDWAYPYYGYGWRSPYYYGGYYGPYYGYYSPYYSWGGYYTPAAWTREQQETAPTIVIKAAEARVRRAVVMAMDTNAATMATSPTRGVTTITATTTRPLAATTAVRAVVRSAVEAHTAVEVRSVVATPVARNPAEAEHLVADAKQRQ